MTFEVVSTRSWNVLGTFEDEDVAREAVRTLISGSGVDACVVYHSEIWTYEADELLRWLGREGE